MVCSWLSGKETGPACGCGRSLGTSAGEAHRGAFPQSILSPPKADRRARSRRTGAACGAWRRIGPGPRSCAHDSVQHEIRALCLELAPSLRLNSETSRCFRSASLLQTAVRGPSISRPPRSFQRAPASERDNPIRAASLQQIHSVPRQAGSRAASRGPAERRRRDQAQSAAIELRQSGNQQLAGWRRVSSGKSPVHGSSSDETGAGVRGPLSPRLPSG